MAPFLGRSIKAAGGKETRGLYLFTRRERQNRSRLQILRFQIS